MRYGLVAMALVALGGMARADVESPRRWVSVGFGVGFPHIGHWDVSLWPLRNMSIDGRMSIVGLGWGASAGGTVHIPTRNFGDVLLTGSYGVAKVNRLFGSGEDEYNIVTLGAGLGGRFPSWEWRGELCATHWDNVDSDGDDDWFPMIEFTFSMNFPRP